VTTTDPATDAPPPRHERPPGWGQSLATGAAGIALLHIEHAHTGVGTWDTVHHWVTAMTQEPITAHPDACCLYRGAPAVAFTLHAAARPAHATALSNLDEHITTVTRQRLERAHQRIDRGQLPTLREFDLISGLTGIGVYLLHRRHDDDLLRTVLTYLTRLTEPITVNGETLPGWWTDHGPHDQPSPRWPGGHGNLGIAHGITGPLALLAIALRHGVTVNSHTDAIARLCSSLDQRQQGTPDRPWWPGTLTLTEWTSHTVRQPGPQRPSWCYGTPGIARAQQLAGLALGDPTRQRNAEAALVACVRDNNQLAKLTDASLCHGWAGLLHTTWRAARDAGPDTELAAVVPDLRARMEHHLQHNKPPPAGSGLLEGQAGIQLARHTTATGAPPMSHWDACLLLGP
jgi:hypothetical protein